MKPYYDQDGITIYHGDCREVLPTLQGNALLTDPPYGIAWSRATWSDDPAEYEALMLWLVSTSQMVVPQGLCFVFQAMLQCANWHRWFPDGWRIFAACKNFAQIRPTAVWHSWDPVVFWQNGDKQKPKKFAGPNRDYHVGNVAGVLGEKVGHPSPRPLGTMLHLVNLSTEEGQSIIDPFMCSGTTLVAAKQLGRRAIGIEIEERYCEIAVKRLAQGCLFSELTTPPQPRAEREYESHGHRKPGSVG